MEESGLKGHRTTQKKAELEELWAANAAQESRISDMVGCHAALRALHENMHTDYNVKRSENRELQAKLTRHHEQSREPRRAMEEQFTQDWTACIV